MKKINYIYSFAAVFLLLAASCKDDDLVKPDYEKYNGNEVSFTASVDGKSVTRTYFGNSPEPGKDGTGSYYPLYWSSDDRIVVASPMGESGRNSAVYDIQVPDNYATDPATFAAGINLATQVNPAGVQWSESNEKGQFYAIYPYRAETRRRPESLGTMLEYHNTISLPSGNNGESATALALVEKDQRIWAPPTTKAKPLVEGTAGPNVINMHGSNHANTMWAMTTNVEKGKTVNLRFKPLSTCLMMTFTNGQPQVGSSDQKDAMIEQIQIVAPPETNIAGVMNIKFPDINTNNTTGQIPNGGDATCTLVENATYEKSSELCQSNIITIHPWILATATNADGTVTELPNGIHPTLKPGEQLLVEAFLLPTEEWQITSDWKVRVQLNGRTFERPLVGSGTNLTLKKGQIHEIDYPGFFVDYEWNYNPESWMSEIPDATYLTQLTFPGSWYSYCQNVAHTTNLQRIDNEPYQSLTIENQIAQGVRAFDISTRMGYTNTQVWNATAAANYQPVISGSGHRQSTSNAEYIYAYPVNDAIKKIIDVLDAQFTANATNGLKKGTGIICLGFENATGKGLTNEDRKKWLMSLDSAVYTLPDSYKAKIYGFTGNEAISDTTTLGSVRGKVILKVNVTADNEFDNISEGKDLTIRCPFMISFGTYSWLTKMFYYDESGNKVEWAADNLANTCITAPMYYKKWNTAWRSTVITQLPEERRGVWAFNWSCTNRTSKTQMSYSNANFIPCYQERQDALTRLKQESIDVYKQLYHDEWFMFGFGGTETTDAQSSTVSPEDCATVMNDFALTMIKSYFEGNTPCPMGIVFVNRIGDSAYSGDEILANLIKMNSAFYLQQRPNSGSSSGTQTTSVKSASPNHASGYTTSNGWSVF